jgi:hypothetical protein
MKTATGLLLSLVVGGMAVPASAVAQFSYPGVGRPNPNNGGGIGNQLEIPTGKRTKNLFFRSPGQVAFTSGLGGRGNRDVDPVKEFPRVRSNGGPVEAGDGLDALRHMLRGLTLSLLVFVAFFLMVGISLPTAGLVASFVFAAALVLVIDAVLLVLLRRRQRA